MFKSTKWYCIRTRNRINFLKRGFKNNFTHIKLSFSVTGPNNFTVVKESNQFLMVPTKRITSTPLKLLLKNHRLKSSFIKILWKPFNRINSPVYGLLKIDVWKLTEMVKILLVVWVKKRKRMWLRDFFYPQGSWQWRVSYSGKTLLFHLFYSNFEPASVNKGTMNRFDFFPHWTEARAR